MLKLNQSIYSILFSIYKYGSYPFFFQCNELKLLHESSGQSQLLHSSAVIDSCKDNPNSINVCPFVLRLAEYLQTSIYDLGINETTFDFLYNNCLEGKHEFFQLITSNFQSLVYINVSLKT